MERLKEMLEAQGMIIVRDDAILANPDIKLIEAYIPVGGRELRIFCGSNGTARIDKPNGTHKWVYEKSYAQICAIIRQTLSFYRF